ncbi:MAG: c-type cytochrome, partial [Rhodothermales bacterium]|nr:c-type cytochrome [Rhodothermales bacterium]
MIDPIDAGIIPDAPVLSPQEALADFVVEPGFDVDLIAAEPDIVAPVALTFDGDGAIWVVEMRAYMEDIEGSTEDKPIGSIRVLRDLDGDHEYETVSTFLDGLVLPRAIAIANGGLLVAEPPNLWFYENDNYVAGQKTLVDSTYAVGGNPEHQPNGLVRAIDNWIYSAKADFRYRFRNGVWEKDKTEYRGQWGISQDDYGRLFYNHNSATLLGDNLTPGVMHYNPHHEIRSRNFGAPKASNKVYPIRINPGVNRAYRKVTLDDEGKLDNMTAACGPVIYRGTNFPASYYGNAFVMEPAGNLIKRVVLKDSSGVVSGSFPYEGREFLASTDERFRPVNSYTAPDGSLLIVDMYRGVIQHSTYLTEYLQRQIKARGLEQPLDLGRIYRVKRSDAPLGEQPGLIGMPSSELVKQLQHGNGWWRDTAQQLLIERDDHSIARQLRDLARDDSRPVSQVHALWTLEGLQLLTITDLERAARTARSAKVTTNVLRLAAGFSESRAASRALALIENTRGGGREIELQRILSMHSFRENYEDRVLDRLAGLSSTHSSNQEFVDAIVGGLSGVETRFMERLADTRISESEPLYASLEQARFGEQMRPVLTALDPGSEHADFLNRGRAAYNRDCSMCHGRDGKGLAATAPSLIRSKWVLQNPETVIKIVLDGLSGPIEVNGQVLDEDDVLDVMPGFRNSEAMSDEELAALVSYVRNGWSNRAGLVEASRVEQ